MFGVGYNRKGGLDMRRCANIWRTAWIPQTFWETPTEGEDEDSDKNAKN